MRGDPAATERSDLGLVPRHAVIFRAAVDMGTVSVETLTAHEQCRAAGVGRQEVSDALAIFVDRQLVTRDLGQPGRYHVVDPVLSLGQWATDLERAAQDVAAEIDRLSQRHRRRHTSSSDSFVQVVHDVNKAKAQVLAAHQGAEREVLAMERAPYQGSAGDLGDVELALLEAGVVHRVLYDTSELETRLSDIQLGIAAGERARAMANLPLRAFVVDRRIAFVPARRGSFLVDPLVIVHQGSLLDAITETFEACWERAVPLNPGHQKQDADGGLVALLAAGLTDAAIARHLRVSRRTVQRRISKLMHELGVNNRFQAGLVVRRYGLLDEKAEAFAAAASPDPSRFGERGATGWPPLGAREGPPPPG